MPTGWTRVGTPDDLRELLDKPEEFKREVHKRVARAGAGLHEVYFEKRGGPAYILTLIPGSRRGAEAIVEKLKKGLGDDTEVLFTAEELPPKQPPRSSRRRK
jgi:hypothetical protein